MVSQSGEASLRRWYGRIVRRWYLAVFWLAAVVFGVVALFVAVPTQYQASGQLLLLPPAQPLVEGERRNTYLFLPDGLVLTAILVANTVNTPDVARELTDEGFKSTYTVGVVPGTGPLITITVKDVDPRQALALRDEMLDRLEAEIDRIQAAEDVPTGQLMEPRRFSASTRAEELAGSRIRALIGIVAAGVVLGGLSITEVDRRLLRRAAPLEPESSPPTSASSRKLADAASGTAGQAPQNNELDGLLSLLANLPSPQSDEPQTYGQQRVTTAPQQANGNGNGHKLTAPPNMPLTDPWGASEATANRPLAPSPPGKPPGQPGQQN